MLKLPMFLIILMFCSSASVAALERSAEDEAFLSGVNRSPDERIVQIFKETNSQNRRHVEEIYSTAEMLLKYTDTFEKGMRAYRRGIEAEPWNMNARYRFAELLERQGRRDEAVDHLKFIYDHAEDEQIVQSARGRLVALDPSFKEVVPDVSPSTTYPSKPEMVIVPVGQVNRRYLEELCVKLEEVTDIRFVVGAAVDPGSPDRNALDLKLDRYVTAILASPNGTKLKETLGDLDVKRVAALDFETKVRALDTAYAPEGLPRDTNSAIARYALIRGSSWQYDADRLLLLLARTFPSKKPWVMGYIGLTDEDLYMGDGNWVYANSKRNELAIVSYYRFLATNSLEPPSRPMLIERTAKAVLGAVSLVIGQNRCYKPSCGFGYAYSLRELDRKKIELCNNCEKILTASAKEAVIDA